MKIILFLCWAGILYLACIAGKHDNIYLLLFVWYASYILLIRFPVFKSKVEDKKGNNEE